MATKAKNDETKTAGTDQSSTLETTEQAAAKDENQDGKVEERGETDPKAAASGESLGAVKDGDSGLTPEDEDDYAYEVEEFEDGEVEGASGEVTERNNDGDEYDVPFVYLTPDNLARTSDSDDPVKDWTAQHAGGERKDEDDNDIDPVALVAVQGIPGQTFRVRELPNREVVEAAGIDYAQFVSGLPVRADVPNEAPRRGIPA